MEEEWKRLGAAKSREDKILLFFFKIKQHNTYFASLTPIKLNQEKKYKNYTVVIKMVVRCLKSFSVKSLFLFL